ncbi:MAG: hypothetical protein WDW38_001267 [Sanguina aurantia]
MKTSAVGSQVKAVQQTRTARPCVVVRSSSSHATTSSRRDMIIGTGAVLAAPLFVAPLATAAEDNQRFLQVKGLGSFQRSDQRTEYKLMATAVLKEALLPADSSFAVRLAFNDAATYDINTKTGGFDGSVVLSSELDRPENVMLKPLVERLAEAKKTIDANGAKTGAGPISWADLIMLAGKVSTQKSWVQMKVKRAVTESGGELIAGPLGSPWDVRLGRVDNATAAPEGRIPTAESSIPEIKAFFRFDPAAEEIRMAAADPTFADYKKKYDMSRRTLTRTDYEVDFIAYYTRLVDLGATFNPDAYLYPIPLGPLKL